MSLKGNLSKMVEDWDVWSSKADAAFLLSINAKPFGCKALEHQADHCTNMQRTEGLWGWHAMGRNLKLVYVVNTSYENCAMYSFWSVFIGAETSFWEWMEAITSSNRWMHRDLSKNCKHFRRESKSTFSTNFSFPFLLHFSSYLETWVFLASISFS